MSSTSTTDLREGAAGGIRRWGLALVMLGSLSVSVRGQIEAVWPLLGPMSIVLALTNDVAALLALNEVISTRRAEVRRWAWAVLLLAGGTAAGLNTWHALDSNRLPTMWAVVVGAGPVLLSMVLSHLVALASTGHRPASTAADATHDVLPAEAPTATSARIERVAAPVGRQSSTAPELPALPAVSTSRAGQVPATLPSTGIHRTLSVVASQAPAGSVQEPVESGSSTSTDPRVAQLVDRIQSGATLTGSDVGELLGCSERTGRRLLSKAQEQLDAEQSDSAVDANAHVTAMGERSTG